MITVYSFSADTETKILTYTKEKWEWLNLNEYKPIKTAWDARKCAKSNCEEMFIPKNLKAIYCSTRCQNNAKQDRHRELKKVE